MRLYYAPGACSLSPHIVAREAGLPVEISKVTFDGAARTTEQGENYFEVNAKGGYVPALRLDDGSVLAEGGAIIQYLADQAPDKALMPAPGSMERYRAIEWIFFISTEIHKGFSVFFRADAPEAEKELAKAKLLKRFAYVESALTGKEYVLSVFSAADAYLYTIIRWSPKAQIAFGEMPNIAAFIKRMEARAGVQAALSEEGLAAFGS